MSHIKENLVEANTEGGVYLHRCAAASPTKAPKCVSICGLCQQHWCVTQLIWIAREFLLGRHSKTNNASTQIPDQLELLARDTENTRLRQKQLKENFPQVNKVNKLSSAVHIVWCKRVANLKRLRELLICTKQAILKSTTFEATSWQISTTIISPNKKLLQAKKTSVQRKTTFLVTTQRLPTV